MAKISAILTSYNVELYIATAMQSVIDAGFDTLELIVVDDGSTDATRTVADVIGTSAAGPRVDYVPLFFNRNTIGGVACAANAGLDYATGDIVIMVDGDDWVSPAPLRQAVAQLERSQADFIVCGCQEYWNDTGAYTHYPEGHLWAQALQEARPDIRRDLLLKMAPFPWRKIYRRAFLERHQIRFPVGDYFFEDNPFHWETTIKADRFSFFEPVTHTHRMARQGQTVTGMGVKPLQIFEHAKTIRNTLNATGQSDTLSDAYFHWLVDHVLWCCRYVAPKGLNTLFDQATQAFKPYPDALFFALLEEKEHNWAEINRLTALKLNDRMAFLASLRP